MPQHEQIEQAKAAVDFSDWLDKMHYHPANEQEEEQYFTEYAIYLELLEKKEKEKPMSNKIIIVLDSNEGHITKVFTSDPTLEVKLIDVDPDALDIIFGPYDPEVTRVVEDVDAAALKYIQEEFPEEENKDA